MTTQQHVFVVDQQYHSLAPIIVYTYDVHIYTYTYLCIHVLEVNDCDILRHHDSRIMTYHDCENYHDCHILQTFGTNKHAVVYKILSDTYHRW